MKPRVVSLVPSVTETLISWGVVPVGCTRSCEHPERPAMGGTRSPDLEWIVVAATPELVVLDREGNCRPDAGALAAAGLALHVSDVLSLADVTALRDALGVGEEGKDAPFPDPVRSERPVMVERGGLAASAYVDLRRDPRVVVARGGRGAQRARRASRPLPAGPLGAGRRPPSPRGARPAPGADR